MIGQTPYFILGVHFSFVASLACGQSFTSSSSYAAQLIRYDRNGDGRLDERERAAMTPRAEQKEPVRGGLPLICDRQAEGDSLGGSRLVSEEQQAAALARLREEELRAQGAQPQRRQPRADPAADGNAAPPGERVAGDGYAPQQPTGQAAPPLPPARMSRSVQYRLIKNEELRQVRANQVRKAATFGRTVGRNKRSLGPKRSQCRATISLEVDVYRVAR